MVESADWLCQKHFGKQLIEKNVEILDPAVGGDSCGDLSLGKSPIGSLF